MLLKALIFAQDFFPRPHNIIVVPVLFRHCFLYTVFLWFPWLHVIYSSPRRWLSKTVVNIAALLTVFIYKQGPFCIIHTFVTLWWSLNTADTKWVCCEYQSATIKKKSINIFWLVWAVQHFKEIMSFPPDGQSSISDLIIHSMHIWLFDEH